MLTPSCWLVLETVILTAPIPSTDRSGGGKLEHLYHVDFRARRADEKEFGARTHSFAFDVFIDRTNRRLLYVDPDGKNPAAVEADPEFKVRENKAPGSLHRVIMPVRHFEEKDFGEKTGRVGVEVYRDRNTNHLILVSEKGALAIIPEGKLAPEKPGQELKWQDRHKLRVREAKEATFEHFKCNVEVYHEPRTDRLLYVGDSGALGVLSPVKKPELPQTEFAHGLILKARPPGDDNFGPDTPMFSLEVYRDGARGAWLYVTDSLQLIVQPGAAAKPDPGRILDSEWKGSLMPEKTPRWGGEVYLDRNTGLTLLATSGKGLAILPGK
jgi:hypothetical protein